MELRSDRLNPVRTSSPLHAVTWALWAVAAASTVQLAPSPVYVALVVAVAFLVVSAHRIDTALSRAFPLLLGVGVAFALLRVVLTALTSHDLEGSDSGIWFTLPAFTLPRFFGGFTVGGAIEGVVVWTTLSQAFAVIGIMAIFGAFNSVASHHELVQATPRAFHEPGLIVTVALAFVPSTMSAFRDVREADRARTGGRTVKRGRLLRTTLPVVDSGLERAMALAESMDARGFARHARGRADVLAGWLGLGSLLALGAAFMALVGKNERAAVIGAVVGVAALAAAVAASSAGARHTRYRPRRLTRLDVAVMAAVGFAPLGLAALRISGFEGLTWWPDPVVFPEFSVGPALCLAFLAAPVAVRPLPLTTTVPVRSPAGSTATDRARDETGHDDDDGDVTWRIRPPHLVSTERGRP